MSSAYVAVTKSHKDFRKGEVLECYWVLAYDLINLGVAETISKETYDLICLEKWKREVKMKHGEDKMFICDAWFNFLQTKGR